MKLATLAAIMLLSGCATIVSGTTQPVRFTSDPPGATVHIQDQQCTTPGTVTLRRGMWVSRVVVAVSPDGRKTLFNLPPHFDSWYWGNLLFGPAAVIGAIVDSSTGADYGWRDHHIEFPSGD